MSTIDHLRLPRIPRDTPAEQPHFGSAGASYDLAPAPPRYAPTNSFASPICSSAAIICRTLLCFASLSTLIFAQGSDEAARNDSQVANGNLTASEGLLTVQAIESTVVDAIERCERSVVAITRVRNDQVARTQVDAFRPNASLQLTEDPTSEDYIPTFFGSGVIISQEGFIVTCAHILDDPRRHRYYVWLDHRCYTATVVGKVAAPMAADPFSDLAILKIDADDLIPMPLSKTVPKKGQFVLGLGNPYAIARDGQASASWGIISNINRFAPKETEGSPTENIHQLGTLIHTDLRLPTGSSGGALINLKGELVGLTTTLVAGRGYEQSAGFAIACDEFYQDVVETLKQGKQPEYGFLGIQPENLRAFDKDRGLSGARVSMVIPGLPGSLAGLREGDVISQVDQATIRNRNDLFRELSKVSTGKRTKLVVHRLRPSGPPQVLSIEAELTKKFLATNRPSFSLHGPAVWRGAQVEYQSAIAGELERIAVVRVGPKVAFLSVAPGSACWQAGIRAGYGIVSVNGQSIDTPAKFHEIAEQAQGDVTLVVLATNGRELRATVSASSDG